MKDILEHLYQHKTLTKNEAKEVLTAIATGKYKHNQIASFVTTFIMRNITLEELSGFREALIALSNKIDLSFCNPMDVCGTGGDGKNTFNISTLTSFVVAGSGIPVAKHGNYGVSSISGSSNVLECLGITFHTNEDILKTQIQESNICFLHAPLFHPALKHVAPVRKELGVKTFFNMLGPLVNPAQPKVQMAGVFNLELARMYQYLFQQEEIQYSIVHSIDGYDEITLTANSKIFNNKGESILKAEHMGLSECTADTLYGGNSIEEAAQIFINVIEGKGTIYQNNVVLANAATAIKTYYPDKEYEEAVAIAKDSLFELKAKKAFTTLKAIQ